MFQYWGVKQLCKYIFNYDKLLDLVTEWDRQMSRNIEELSWNHLIPLPSAYRGRQICPSLSGHSIEGVRWKEAMFSSNFPCLVYITILPNPTHKVPDVWTALGSQHLSSCGVFVSYVISGGYLLLYIIVEVSVCLWFRYKYLRIDPKAFVGLVGLHVSTC